MPSNNTGRIVKDLFAKYPDKMALLLNPRNVSAHQLKFRHAMDNDCFNQFNEKQFFKVSLGDYNDPDDQDIYDYCLENDCISIGYGEDIDFSSCNQTNLNFPF